MDSKKRLLIYLVFVFGISIFLYGFVSLTNSNATGKATAPSSTPSSIYSCVDSDSGINFFFQGIITITHNGETVSRQDFCSEDNLTEYSCETDTSSTATATNHVCKFGCEAGACVSCYDSDINDSDPTVKIADEYCSSTGNGVYESYCQSNASIDYALEACPSGTKCYDGACVSCYDSDNGRNYSASGFTWNASYTFNTGFSDECLGEDMLNEFYCNGNSMINETKNCSVEYSPGYDCEAGACVCVPDWEFLDCTSGDVGAWHDANNCGEEHSISGCDYNNNGVMWSSVSPFSQNDISIGGEDFDNSETYTGIKLVNLKDGKNNIQFDWDFSEPLNLQEVNVLSAESDFDWNYILISGLNVGNKTIFIDRFNDSDSVCIIDQESVVPSDFSDYCNASNEILVPCPGVDNVSSPRYHCQLSNNGSEFKVWPLAHSGVAEWFTGGVTSSCVSDWNCTEWNNCSCEDCDDGIQYRDCTDLKGCLPDYTENQSCGQCVSDWNCPTWDSVDCINGQKTRMCIDSNSCSTETNKPSGFISCTDKNKGSLLPLILILLGGIILVALIIYLFMHKKEKGDSAVSQTYSPRPPVTPQTRVYTPKPVR